MSFTNGDISRIPFIGFDNKEKINLRIQQNITLSRLDWDSHETSWDFAENPLVALANQRVKNEGESVRMADIVEQFEADWTEKFMQLHENEEQLNREFISIYGLEDELSPDVPLSEITILQQGEVTIEKE